MIESLSKDSFYGFRIVNGINKYLTETSEELSIEIVQLEMSTERRVAKAKPRPKLVVNLFSNFVPVHERRWMSSNFVPIHEKEMDRH